MLRRYVASDQISGERGSQALDDLAAFSLRRYPHEILIGRIWELRAIV